MVDFARVQNRIYYGYGKAATRLGTNHDIYRTTNPINPIQSANFFATQLFSVDQNLKYMSPKKYGDLIWQFLPFNGLVLQNYDYFVNSTTTYFIADIIPTDRLSPPLCVECNAIIQISRPANSPLTPGTNPYQQYQPSASTITALNLPVMLLSHTRSSPKAMNLPTSVKLPYFSITMPELDDLAVNVGDIINDNNGRRLVVLSAELTKKTLGFRIIAAELGV